jgi:hypothetical protein
MARRLPHIQHSRKLRAVYIVCICFVLSYIFFDVLDLDGSDFPSRVAPLKRFSIVAVIPSDAEAAHLSDPADHVQSFTAVVTDHFREYARFQTTTLPESSLFASARAHGYRRGLARDALPD